MWTLRGYCRWEGLSSSQTTKKFLVRDKNSTVDTNTSQITGWKYILLPEESHRILADICASWISLMTLDRKGIKKGEFGSSRYWVMHFRQACMQDGNPLITPRNVALRSKFRHTSSLVQILYSQLDCWFYWGRLHTLDYIRFGAAGVVKLLLATEKVDIDFKDSDGQTPLLMAARGGNERLVKLLQRS